MKQTTIWISALLLAFGALGVATNAYADTKKCQLGVKGNSLKSDCTDKEIYTSSSELQDTYRGGGIESIVDKNCFPLPTTCRKVGDPYVTEEGRTWAQYICACEW